MMCRKSIPVLVFCSIVFLWVGGAVHAGEGCTKPSRDDKCPVCGMFVAKYPDWTGEILFDDGSAVFFDGAKDLFKYYLNIGRYNPGKSREAVKDICVTEYYSVGFIDARSAHYVIGSDVYGPMGHELIPFQNESDAREFLKDHKGREIVGFDAVSPRLIESLD